MQCVECGAAVLHLYKEYSKGNIRLSICEKCNATVDKYVEYEVVLILIDLLLHKPQAYRHILFNRKPSLSFLLLLRLACIITLLDMNMKAFLIERRQLVVVRDGSMYENATPNSIFGVSQLSLHLFSLAAIENLTYGLVITALIRCFWSKRCNTQLLSTLVVSSFGKIFIMFSVIWNYHWTLIPVVGGFVLTSHHVGLSIYLNDSSWKVMLLIVTAMLSRGFIQYILYIMGNSMIFLTI